MYFKAYQSLDEWMSPFDDEIRNDDSIDFMHSYVLFNADRYYENKNIILCNKRVYALDKPTFMKLRE